MTALQTFPLQLASHGIAGLQLLGDILAKAKSWFAALSAQWRSSMGRPQGQINQAHFQYLRKLAEGPRIYSMGNSVLGSLVSRGMVEVGEMVSYPPRRYAHVYSITEAGRRALKGGGNG